MPHEVIASLRVVLPDAPGAMVRRLSEIAEAWAEMLATLDPFDGESAFTVNEVRKRADAGTKRPRKPRISVVPGDGPDIAA